ncbi:hypothetical protein C8035_v004773 [Colletotrichum spinosum]|uniref:Uncharacterized protein n=1 Tax=Colletotrichum spinosum TaxID=1347390 RepID=A0A4R8QRI9_9PEZI|nr:hypothetical protein C8035_v004773 [Colletotrichum spinosum]
MKILSTLSDLGGDAKTTADNVAWASFSSSDPYFAYRGLASFKIESTWKTRWSLV